MWHRELDAVEAMEESSSMSSGDIEETTPKPTPETTTEPTTEPTKLTFGDAGPLGA